MKYFEKGAAGPIIHITKDPTRSFGGMYLSGSNIKELYGSKDLGPAPPKTVVNKTLIKQRQIAREKGVITGNIGKKELPWTSKTDIKRHELVHYLRSEKGKWSSKKYDKSRVARFVEETAAYRRGGENIGRSVQGALATAVGQESKIFKLLRKIK